MTIVTEPRLGYVRTNPYTVLSQPSIPPSDLDLVSCLLMFGNTSGELKDSKLMIKAVFDWEIEKKSG